MTRSASVARRLSDGLYGRIEFDFACNRGHGFGEAHLHGAIMEILASNVDPKTTSIQPSYPVDVIQRPHGAGIGSRGGNAGRKREVDFAVLTRVESPETPVLAHCIEAKWAGSSHAKPDNVLIDLTRLALISQEHPEATCLFLLAGGKSSVANLLERRLPKLSKRVGATPLQHAYLPNGNPHLFNLRNARGRDGALDAKRSELLAAKFQRVPVQLRTTMYKPAHDTPPNWRVHVWRVSAPPG